MSLPRKRGHSYRYRVSSQGFYVKQPAGLISYLPAVDIYPISALLPVMATLKLILVFILILIALRKKVSVGVTLFGAGVLTALLYQVDIPDLLDGYWELIKSRRFISLTAAICLITMLGALLKEIGFLSRLTESCRGLWGGRRTATAMLPPLVGMMPMPGGSLLSAPLVDNVLSDPKYTPHFKCAVNYYFRHVIEHFWPIYPGMIVTEAITGLPIATVALLQSPLAVIMLILGFVFFLRRITNAAGERKDTMRSLYGIISALWPMAIAIAVYGILKIELSLAVLAAFLILVLVRRPHWHSISVSLKKGLSYKLIFLVFGILSFQTAIHLSGAVELLQQVSIRYGLPAELVIIIVCFASGILTGMYAAYVALGYSLLAGFLYQPEIIPSHIFLAFLSGYVGMMLSPAHLCLIVTNEYFKSDLLKVYRTMVIPFLLLGVIGYLIYLTPWASLVYP